MSPAPVFTLRRITDQLHRPNAWRVMLGELEVGGIERISAAAQREFWAWRFGLMRPVAGTHGEAESREAAMAAFRAAWAAIVTDEDVAKLSAEAEWTARKYRMWADGKRGTAAMWREPGNTPTDRKDGQSD